MRDWNGIDVYGSINEVSDKGGNDKQIINSSDDVGLRHQSLSPEI
jgi:hypothetical protein